MHQLKVTRTIDASAAAVWSTLNDFGNVRKWHPAIASSVTLFGKPSGEGAVRESRYYGGGRIAEAITRHVPGRCIEMRLVDRGPFPVTFAETTIQLQEIGIAKTQVEIRTRFVPRFGLFGRLAGVLAIAPRFRRLHAQGLAGLQRYLAGPRRAPARPAQTCWRLG